MSTSLKTTLQQIHKNALRNFTYRSDSELRGVNEHWSYPGEYWNVGEKFSGDCDDFAMYCRTACADRGIDSRLVICNADGQMHLVLEVQGFILDNRMLGVFANTSPKFKNYKWLYLSGYEPGDEWTSIKKGPTNRQT